MLPETDRWTVMLRQAVADDSGQDVVEYALLGAIVGVASVLTWKLLATTVGDVYGAADTDVQGVSACTPDPGGAGCS
jgi:Flp pilus assembly pilin Flp